MFSLSLREFSLSILASSYSLKTCMLGTLGVPVVVGLCVPSNKLVSSAEYPAFFPVTAWIGLSFSDLDK